MADDYPLMTDEQPQTAPRPAAPIPQVPPQQQGVEQGGLVGQWKSWLSDPANQSALTQFGVSLMQPVGLGQTALGHVGQAIGSAGAAAGRVQKEELDQQKADATSELRESQLQNSTVRNQASGDRLELSRERLAMQQRLEDLRRNTQLYIAYNNHVTKLRAANELSTTPTPVPTFEEWVGANPALVEQSGATTKPKETSSTSTAAPKVGEVRKGYRFKGGNPSQPSSWEKATQ